MLIVGIFLLMLSARAAVSDSAQPPNQDSARAAVSAPNGDNQFPDDDLVASIDGLLVKMPDWARFYPNENHAAELSDIELTMREIAACDLDTIRAAMVSYIRAREVTYFDGQNSPTGKGLKDGDEAKLFLLNTFLFSLPNTVSRDDRAHDPRHAYWGALVPYDKDVVYASWPWVQKESGSVVLAGVPRGGPLAYSGPVYEPVSVFDSYRKIFGKRLIKAYDVVRVMEVVGLLDSMADWTLFRRGEDHRREQTQIESAVRRIASYDCDTIWAALVRYVASHSKILRDGQGRPIATGLSTGDETKLLIMNNFLFALPETLTPADIEGYSGNPRWFSLAPARDGRIFVMWPWAGEKDGSVRLTGTPDTERWGKQYEALLVFDMFRRVFGKRD